MRSKTGAGRHLGRALTGNPLSCLDQFLERFLISITGHRRIEAAGFALDDHAGDRYGLGIKLARKVVELRRSDFLGGAQCDQCETSAPWFDQHHALATAEREPSQTGHASFSHRGADRALGLGRNRAVGVHKIGRV
jgi:hypothetical protein